MAQWSKYLEVRDMSDQIAPFHSMIANWLARDMMMVHDC